MEEWEDRINQVLNDPEQMEKISHLAQSLMGGGDGETPSASPLEGLGLDVGMLGRVGQLLSQETGQSRQQGLLSAMKPYLSPKRQEKLDRAMKLARLSHLAKLALGEDKGHVPRPTPPPPMPPRRSGLFDSLGRMLPGMNAQLETEDVILLLILYLMYRESGDSDLLTIMGAMFLL